MTKYYVLAVIVGLSAALILLHPGVPGVLILVGPRLCLLTAALILPNNALALANLLFLAFTYAGLGLRPGVLRLSFLSSIIGLFGRMEIFVSPVCIVPFLWLLWLALSGLSNAGIQTKGMLLDLFAVSLGELLASGLRRRVSSAQTHRPNPSQELIPLLTFLCVVLGALLIRPVWSYRKEFDALLRMADSRAVAVFCACAILGVLLWVSFRLMSRQLGFLFDACIAKLIPAPERSFAWQTPGADSATFPVLLRQPGDAYAEALHQVRELANERSDLAYRARQLRCSARELTVLLQDMPHAALLVNSDGLIIFLSPSLKALLQVNIQDTSGTSFRSLKDSESPFAEEFVAIVQSAFDEAQNGSQALSRVVFTKQHGGDSLKLSITASAVYHAELDRDATILSIFVVREAELKNFAADILRPQPSEVFGSMDPIPDFGLRSMLELKVRESDDILSVNLLREFELALEQVQSTLHMAAGLRIAVERPPGTEATQPFPFQIAIHRRLFGGLLRYLMSLLHHVLPQGGIELSLGIHDIGTGTGTFMRGAYPGRFFRLAITCSLGRDADELIRILREPGAIGQRPESQDIECILFLLSQQALAADGFLGISGRGSDRKQLEIYLPEAARPDRTISQIASFDVMDSARTNAIFVGTDAKLAQQLRHRLASIGFELAYRSLEDVMASILPPVSFEGSGFFTLDGHSRTVQEADAASCIDWGARRLELLIIEISRLDPETQRLLELIQQAEEPQNRFLVVPESLQTQVVNLGFRILCKPIDEGTLEVEVQAALHAVSRDDELQNLVDSIFEA